LLPTSSTTPYSSILAFASTQRAWAWQYMPNAVPSICVSTFISDRIGTIRRHSFLAALFRCDGQRGSLAGGFGSRRFRGRLPGLPPRILSFNGFGFGPRFILAPSLY